MYKEGTLKRFAKDFGLPIQVFQEENFHYLLELYADTLGAKQKFELLRQGISEIGSESQFVSYCNAVRDGAIKALSETEAFLAFNKEDLGKYDTVGKNYVSKGVYHPRHNGEKFVSFDLLKANFQAMRWHNPELVMNAKSYGEMLELFTRMAYIHQSKRFRQVIFGNLNPKRQAKIQRWMMEQILFYLVENHQFSTDDICTTSPDEIVFKLPGGVCAKSFEALIKNALEIEVSVKTFRLEQLGNKPYYAKRSLDNGTSELACVPNVFYAQAMKFANRLPVAKEDLAFVHEGQLAYFAEPLSFMEEEREERNDAD